MELAMLNEPTITDLLQQYGDLTYIEYGEEFAAPNLSLPKGQDFTPTQWEYIVLPLVERHYQERYGFPIPYVLIEFLSQKIGKSVSEIAGDRFFPEQSAEYGFTLCTDTRPLSRHGLLNMPNVFQRPRGAKRVYLHIHADGTGTMFTSKTSYPVKGWKHLNILALGIPCEPLSAEKAKERLERVEQMFEAAIAK